MGPDAWRGMGPSERARGGDNTACSAWKRCAFCSQAAWSIYVLIAGHQRIAQSLPAGSNPSIVWNFPVDLTFQATNAFGWPKIHFSVYGLDFLGTDVVHGYGFTHIPCSAGRFELKVHLFKPKTRTGMTGLQSWILRRPAEFKQPDFVCQSEGREGVSFTVPEHWTQITLERVFLLASNNWNEDALVGYRNLGCNKFSVRSAI
jgi:hypothetical protein